MQESVALKTLRDRPFELLAELERRGRAVTASSAAAGVSRSYVVPIAIN